MILEMSIAHIKSEGRVISEQDGLLSLVMHDCICGSDDEPLLNRESAVNLALKKRGVSNLKPPFKINSK